MFSYINYHQHAVNSFKIRERQVFMIFIIRHQKTKSSNIYTRKTLYLNKINMINIKEV